MGPHAIIKLKINVTLVHLFLENKNFIVRSLVLVEAESVLNQMLQLNAVGDEIRSLNEIDMTGQRAKLKDTLEYGGYSRDTPIQCRGTWDVLAENVTAENKIIAYNKGQPIIGSGRYSAHR